MRTDVKVGVTVGLILLSVVVIYIVFFTGGRPVVTEDDRRPLVKKPGGTNILVDSNTAGESDLAGDSVAAGDSIPTIVPGGDATILPLEADTVEDADAALATTDDGIITPGFSGTTDQIPSMTLTPTVDDTSAVPPAYEDDMVDGGVEIVAFSGDTSADEAGTPVPSEMPGATETTYTVKPNDTLWDIAKAKYGQGKYWQHIAKANPGIDPSRLREGMKLKVPPLPPRPQAASTGGGQEGQIVPGVGGERIYIVKKGDNGFWAIAAKPEVYGDGKYWDLIQKANPGVAPESLRPGQELKIPARGATGGAVGTVSTVAAVSKRPTLTEAGTYIVQKGDTGGFSAIAKKVYDDGTLWPAIQQANPGVDTRRLRVGQELIIPSLSKARSAARSSRRTTGAATSAGGAAEAGSSSPSGSSSPVPSTASDFD